MTLSSSKFRNKRNYVRMDVRANITCKNMATGEEITGSCINLSHTGIKFETNELIKKGSELQVTVNVDNDKITPLKADLLVKRVEKYKNKDIYIISGELVNVR